MPEWIWRLKNLLQRRKAIAERSEELQFHYDQEVEAGIRRGLDPQQARREATVRVGTVAQAMEPTSDALAFSWFDGLVTDLRHAFRSLHRNRGFSLVAVLVLAACVAMNTLVFFLLDGVVLRPLPYPSPGQLIRIYDTSRSDPKFPVSIGHYLDYRANAKSLDSIALYTGRDMELTGNGRPERLIGVAVTAEYFTILGSSPSRGRNFTESDLTSGIRQVILSHKLWANRFQSDASIVGKAIQLDRTPWTVIGVAAPGFQHVGGDYRSPMQGESVDIWLPFNLKQPENSVRAFHFSNAIARIRSGFTLTQARDELGRLIRVYNETYPKYGKWEVRAEPLLSEVTGRSSQVVWLLTAAGGLVLLVACASIAGLCIARAMARQKELDLRRALGAKRWQILRVGLAENLILGCAGALLGIAIAAVALPLLRQILPADFPRAHEVALTANAALFAVCVAIFTALAAGLLPYARTAGISSAAQSQNRFTSTRESRRLRTALVVSEIAFAGLLCAGSLFLVRSYQEISAREHGFNPTGALTFEISVPFNAVGGKEDRLIRLFEDVRLKIQGIPGVQSAGATTNLPWSGYDENSSFGIVGRSTSTAASGNDEEGNARFQAATPGYFEAAGMRLVSGRFFDAAQDVKGRPLQVIVNDALVHKYLRDRNPIGTTLDLWGEKRQIAGVVAGIRDYPADLDVKPAFWFPVPQLPFGRLFFTVRTRPGEDPAQFAAAVTAAVHAIDSDLPVANLRTLEQHASAAMASRRFALWLFQAFAILGLALAAAGLYGLLAYLVQQRRKEFGVRMALGASRTDLWKLILTDGIRIAVMGAACCLVLIPIAGMLLKAFLYNVKSYDLLTLAGALTALIAVTLMATLSPAWSATRCDPAAALRDQ